MGTERPTSGVGIVADRPGRLPSPLGLLVHQIGYQNRVFRRVPISAFFTLAFPLMFLLLFAAISGEFKIGIGGGREVSAAQFYAPGLAVFTAASATYTNIGISTAITRDEGILRRVRGTPLPRWVYLGGVVGSGVSIAVFGVLLMLVVGMIVYGVEVDLDRVLPAVVTFVVGTASFAMLGLALAAVAPSGRSSPALAQATMLPMAFVSDVFFPLGDDPVRWLQVVGDVLPLKAFVEAFFTPFDPYQSGSGWEPALLLRMALWGVLGALVAARRFRWEPSVGSGDTGGSGRSRRSRRPEAADV